MDAETVRAKAHEAVAAAADSAMAGAVGWKFETDGLTVFVEMASRRQPERGFVLRVEFDEYPRLPPSYRFVDPTTKEASETAWPPDVKYAGQPPGICTWGTREFHLNYHSNDQQYCWDPEKYTVLDTLHRIQQMMERGLGG